MDDPLVLPAVAAGQLLFHGQNVEYLRFESNGDIYVQGRLVENDKQVVEAVRAWLSNVQRLCAHCGAEIKP